MIDKIIKIAPYMLIPLLAAYLFAMIFYPLWSEKNWDDVQAVWDRWQSLNVGILAFTASVIAFYTSHYRMNKQRERDFVAARAFLPDALSSLCGYLDLCTKLLLEAYNLNPKNDLFEQITPSVLKNPVPSLPSDYKEVFGKCISLAEPNLGDHLAKILKGLQINQARISSLPAELAENSHTIVSRLNILDYLHNVGEIQASINSVFNAARGEELFTTQKLSKDDFVTAYRGLKIIQELDALVAYSSRRLG